MAIVYLAHDPIFNRDVALKVLPAQFTDDPIFHARFETEARVITQLEHNTIVPVYDFGEEDGWPYLVMRLMKGGSLTERLEHGPLSLAETTAIMQRICAAVDRAHAGNIIHRDIKPANVLFDEDGASYLADFGIARLAEHTGTVSYRGTPTSMAPEQWGEGPLDARTDVYQLGVMLFEMLIGHRPFEGDSPAALMRKHLDEPVPSMLSLNSELPPACDAVLARAMAKDPTRRFATAGELASALAAVGDASVSKQEVSLWGWVAVGLIVLAFLLVSSWYLFRPAILGIGKSGTVTFSLDEHVYRVVAREGAKPKNVSLALDKLSPGSDWWLNISPDGEWLVLKTERFDPDCVGWPCLAIVRSDLSRGAAVRADWELVRPEYWGAVASDGNLIVYSDQGPHELDLWVVSRSDTHAENWNAPRLLTGDSQYAFHTVPAISDDGKTVVFNCGEDDGKLNICEVNTDGTGFHIVLKSDDFPSRETESKLEYPDYAPDGSIVFDASEDCSIWRLPPGSVEPVEVKAKVPFGGGSSACVLPDGRIVTRKGFEDFGHQIRVTTPDGSDHFIIPTDMDVRHTVGCGE
jgi:serine/threonine protein kinase